MNYYIAICDDSEETLYNLSTAVKKWAQTEELIVKIDIFSSAENFWFHYEEQPDFDILLLDIEMPGMNGVELAKRIRQTNSNMQIVFITGFPDFIAEGYEVSALHYLMKPVDYEKLSEVLCRAAEKLQKTEKPVLLPVNGEIQRIPTDQIIFVEAFAHTCVITTTDSALETKSNITAIEKILCDTAADSFVRCHRSYIVGIRYIKSLSKTDITLDNGTKLPLSRSNYQSVHQAFIRYFKGESTWD